MNNSQQVLGTESIGKLLLKYSVPAIIGMMVNALYNVVDRMFIGNIPGVGPLAITGLGVTMPIMTIILAFGMLIGVGSATNISIKLGQKRKEEAESIIGNAISLSVIIGILITVIGILFSNSILKAFGASDATLVYAKAYISIILFGSVFNILGMMFNNIIRGDGNPKLSAIIMTVGCATNIVLDALFIFGFNMGIQGAAFATVISQAVTALWGISYYLRGKSNLKFRKSSLKLNKNIGLQVLKLGIPAGFQNSIFAIANLFIQSGVNSLPKIMVDGNSAAANADALIYDVMAAFYVGCSTFTAQNYGAKNKSRVMKSYLVSLTYSFGAGLILGILLVAFGRQFLSLFTNSSEVIDAGMKRIMIMGFSYGFCALMDNSIAGSRGLGKTIVPTIIVITGSCVFRIIWIYTIFAHFKTIPSLYLLYIFSWLITGIAEFIYFISVYKKAIKEMETIENN